MKNILKFIGGLIGGAVIGLLILALIIWLSEGDLSDFNRMGETSWSRLALSVCFALICLPLAVVLQIVLHEAGHWLFGLLSGYEFISFRVFSRALCKNMTGHYEWKKYALAGTLGQCLMAPPADKESSEVPYFWYNAGGVTVNLLLAVLSVIALRTLPSTMFSDCFFLMMAFTGIFVALMNGLPLKMGGMNNDGRNILELHRHPEQRTDFVSQLSIAAELSRGKRLAEMPPQWFTSATIDKNSNLLTLATKINRICWLEDREEWETALQETEELFAKAPALPRLVVMELRSEQVLLELITKNREEVIQRLWTKELQAYVKQTSTYSAGKQALLFAYALILEGNREAAEHIYKEVKAKWNSYAFPGESRGAVALMEKVLDVEQQ